MKDLVKIRMEKYDTPYSRMPTLYSLFDFFVLEDRSVKTLLFREALAFLAVFFGLRILFPYIRERRNFRGSVRLPSQLLS